MRGGAAQVSARSRVIPLPRGQALDDLWRRVKREHATGRHSDEALAVMFAHEGMTVQRLRGRRNRDRKIDPADWATHTAADVRAATQAILAQQAVIEQGGRADAVLAAARQTAGVLTRHRKDAGEARDAIMEVLAEVRRTSVKPAEWEELVKAAAADLDQADRAALRAQLRNVLALHSRAGSIHKVADALLKAQIAERKAWGVADDPKDADPLQGLTDDQLLAEIANIGAQLERVGLPGTATNVLPFQRPAADVATG